jgi:hypothetical protein
MSPLRKALFAFLSLTLLGQCGWMGSETLTFLEGEAVISRGEAVQELNLGVVTHAQGCPVLADAALLALSGPVSEVLTRTHYSKNSVDFCFLLLITAGCPESPSTGVQTNFYPAIVRSCNPGPVT